MRIYRLHRSVWGFGFDRHGMVPNIWHLRLGIWCITNEPR